jgi:hypothetical protein
LIAGVVRIDGVERFRAHSNDAERGVPLITARAHTSKFGQVDSDRGKLGRDVGHIQVFENIRRVVQDLNSCGLIKTLWRIIDDIATFTAKGRQFVERVTSRSW